MPLSIHRKQKENHDQREEVLYNYTGGHPIRFGLKITEMTFLMLQGLVKNCIVHTS